MSDSAGSRDSSPKRAKAGAKRKPSHFGSVNNNEIESPDNLMRALRQEFGELFDPCPFVGKGKLPDFDGLTLEWGAVNYVNPPYNNIEPWCVKAVEESRKGKTCLLFVPVRTGSRYWQNYVYPYADQIRFITGRIIFKGYEKPSPHHLALIVYLPNFRITQSPPPALPHDAGDTFDAQQMLGDAYAQRQFPELTIICSAQHSAVSGNGTDGEAMAYRRKWTERRLSFAKLVAGTGAQDRLYEICLPLFYQMCLYEGSTKSAELLRATLDALSAEDLEAELPLPALLLRFKSLLLCNAKLCTDLLTGNSQLPSRKSGASLQTGISVMTAPWYKDAVGFYTAYVEHVRLERARRTRSHYMVTSDDGEFAQQVLFM